MSHDLTEKKNQYAMLTVSSSTADCLASRLADGAVFKEAAESPNRTLRSRFSIGIVARVIAITQHSIPHCGTMIRDLKDSEN